MTRRSIVLGLKNAIARLSMGETCICSRDASAVSERKNLKCQNLFLGSSDQFLSCKGLAFRSTYASMSKRSYSKGLS